MVVISIVTLWSSLTSVCIQITRGLVEMQILIQWRLEWGLRVCISGNSQVKLMVWIEGSRQFLYSYCSHIDSLLLPPWPSFFCSLIFSYYSCPLLGPLPNLSKSYSFFRPPDRIDCTLELPRDLWKTCEVPEYTPDQLNRDFWRLNSVVIVFKAAQMISIGSPGGEHLP